MATTDKWGQGISLPTLLDEPNIEALIATVNALASPGIMRFQNATARAASIPSPTAGMVTALVNEARIDWHDGSRWDALTPGPWRAFPFFGAHQANSGAPGYRYVNGQVQLRGKTERTAGGQYYTGGDGWNIGQLPSGWRPSTFQHFSVPTELGASIYSVRLQIATDGTVTIHTPPGATSTSNGLHWVAMDGCAFPLDTPPATL
ncbi:hypothetical protein [Streptomyces sp. NPDC054784]